MVALLARASVDGGAQDEADHRDDDRDDEPQKDGRVRPVLHERREAEREREEQRKPLPLRRRGKAETHAGEKEERVGDDASHGRFIPVRGELESRVSKAGQPGLEPGITGFGDRGVIQFCYCPL
jgi:hypothetical protein